MLQLMGGMAYIHSRKVAHRDMKLENCFLDSEVKVKIADFGLHKVFEGEDTTALRTRCGTVNYMAPELCGPGS